MFFFLGLGGALICNTATATNYKACCMLNQIILSYLMI